MNNYIYKYFVYTLILFSSLICIHGQSIQEINEVRSEYDMLKNQNSSQSITTNNVDQTNSLNLPRETSLGVNEINNGLDSLLININKFYGYDFFMRRDSISFWENLPTPANYLLGPGDELTLSLWGETQLRKTYTISREGKIYDDKVGLLNLSGKTVEDSEKYFLNQFGRVYATLKGNTPSTYIDISLGRLKSINVNFVGEVFYPGIYPIHPFSTVITGLIQAGGVDTTGSLRNIQIKREGKIHANIDLYNYLLKGELSNNLQLRDQDIVIIPVRQSTVNIDSAVVRPAIYEAINGETVKDLIDYAGGVKSLASDNIALKRIVPINKRKPNEINFQNLYLDYNNTNLTAVQDGDIITVNYIPKVDQHVEIIGQVKSPGRYNYYSGMKLGDLLKLGSGFEDATFYKSVYHDRAEIVRKDPNNRHAKVIFVNLNNSIQDIELENLDKFIVHANPNFIEKKYVQILGEVNVPGSYALISDNESLGSLINRSGNLTLKALGNGISIYRDRDFVEEIESKEVFFIDDKNLNETIQREIVDKSDKVRVAWGDTSIALMPGDSIIVKKATKTVNISGGVYNPGLIEYRAGASLKYYINAAGGINQYGNKRAIIVLYANGVVKPNRWYSRPKIEDGVTIIINEKQTTQAFNPTEFASTVASFLSSIVTIVVLSKQISSP